MFNGTIFLLASSRPLIWYWQQCDIAAKIVVLIIAVLSVCSFSIILQKILELRQKQTDNRAFEKWLVQAGEISKITSIPTIGKAVSPYAELLVAAHRILREHKEPLSGESDLRFRLSHVENALQRAIARVSARYEKGMIPLGTFVSGGPFLGLLGTVWGVMITFGALTEKASISQLAPGVSGALVATAAGLLLALPATFAYNWVLGKTREMTTELNNFASAVADEIEKEFYRELRDREEEAPDARVQAGVNPFLRDGAAGTESGRDLPRSRPSWD